MSKLDELNAMRPLDPSNPDFPVAIDLMRTSLMKPNAVGAGPFFLLVDSAGKEPIDLVSVVDLPALGVIAHGSSVGEWLSYSKALRIYSLTDRHAMTDVLESVMHRLRRLREETPVSSPSFG